LLVKSQFAGQITFFCWTNHHLLLKPLFRWKISK
jgi:hypothetical protein